MYLYARRHQHPYLPAVVLEYFDRVAEAMVVDTIDGSPAAYTREALELYAGNSWAWTRRLKFERKFMPALAAVLRPEDPLSVDDAAREYHVDREDLKKNIAEWQAGERLSHGKHRGTQKAKKKR